MLFSIELSFHGEGYSSYLNLILSTLPSLFYSVFVSKRPEGRQQSDYARHGHHYTHAFFTIKLLNKGSSEAEEKYYLSRISNEFVFSVASGMNIEKSSATDIIQFASGLDLLGSDIDGKLLISYGINDCEAASISLNMKLVQELLIQVPDGSEVGDLMQKL